MLVKDLYVDFKDVFSNPKFFGPLIVIGTSATVFIPEYSENFFLLTKFSVAVALTGIFGAFKYFENPLYSTSAGKFLAKIGTLTLEIYLLHYFVIDSLKHVFAPWVSDSPSLWMYPIALVVVMTIVLIVIQILKLTRIHPILFPKYRDLKKRLATIFNRMQTLE